MTGPDPFDVETEERGDLIDVDGHYAQCIPSVRWTDTEGSHAVKVSKDATIGSAPGSQVRVCDPTVSRLHAEFSFEDDGLWVRDLHSRNGTFVQGLRVLGARVPDHGLVRVGGTDIEVIYDDAPTKLPLFAGSQFGALIGRSNAMRRLFFQMNQLAKLDEPVVISGPTGTGKELVAREIHAHSPRASSPFVVVDCAAMAENLLESELFGHEAGAFTGAVQKRIGQVEYAEGGSVFLDEIGELPLSLQPKLLRLLENSSFRPLGSTEYRTANVRFLAATHRNLATMVNEETFREDLYFRLSVFRLDVPALSRRTDDIELLARRFASQGHDETPELSSALIGELQARPWPGNVRELRNYVRRAVALGSEAARALDEPPTASQLSAPPTVDVDLRYDQAREKVLAQFERNYIDALLAKHDHNISQAARAAGINRSYIYKLLKKNDDV